MVALIPPALLLCAILPVCHASSLASFGPGYDCPVDRASAASALASLDGYADSAERLEDGSRIASAMAPWDVSGVPQSADPAAHLRPGDMSALSGLSPLAPEPSRAPGTGPAPPGSRWDLLLPARSVVGPELGTFILLVIGLTLVVRRLMANRGRHAEAGS